MNEHLASAQSSYQNAILKKKFEIKSQMLCGYKNLFHTSPICVKVKTADQRNSPIRLYQHTTTVHLHQHTMTIHRNLMLHSANCTRGQTDEWWTRVKFPEFENSHKICPKIKHCSDYWAEISFSVTRQNYCGSTFRFHYLQKEIYHRNKFKNKVITITLEQSYFEGYKYISIRVNENS